MRFTHAASARTAFPDIEVQTYEKAGKFFLAGCLTTARSRLQFSHGVPVSDRAGHGIGVPQHLHSIVESDTAVYTAFRSGISSLSCEFHFKGCRRNYVSPTSRNGPPFKVRSKVSS